MDFGTSFWENRRVCWSLIWVFAWGWGTVLLGISSDDNYTCPAHWPWPWAAPECVQLMVFSKNFFSVSCSVQSLSCVRLFVTPWTAALQASLSINNSRVDSNSCPLSQWCHPTISSSVVPFSSRLQSFPASGSFPVSQFFSSGDQSIGVSASASVLTMNIQTNFL